MIHEINQTLSEILAARGLDWRQCYAHVHARPPDAAAIVCECSDRGVLDELEARWAEAFPTVRFVHLPTDAEGLPERLIAASSVADVRKTPSHQSELLTQVIYGDEVGPLKIEGDWFLVRLDDGYVGWIRSWHLQAVSSERHDDFRMGAEHRISVNNAVVLDGPDGDALPVSDVVIGTPVRCGPSHRRGWRSVELPDGKEGFVRSRSVEKVPRARRRGIRGISRESLSSTGLRFLGIPYIWGGTTPKGFDCSGLIQRIYRLNGLVIPRDADLQAEFGREKAVGNSAGLDTGDLLFFGKTRDRITHVAMSLSEGLFLHAYGQVRVGSVDPTSGLFEGKLVNDWQVTRDPISY